MSPEEILADLRDIRLPDDGAALTGAGFSWIPLAVLAGLVLVVLAVRRFRAGHWRRAARADLRRVRNAAGAEARWHALVTLRLGLTGQLRRRPSPPPEALFRRAVHATDQDADALARHIEQELAR